MVLSDDTRRDARFGWVLPSNLRDEKGEADGTLWLEPNHKNLAVGSDLIGDHLLGAILLNAESHGRCAIGP